MTDEASAAAPASPNPTAAPAAGQSGLRGWVLKALDSKHATLAMGAVAVVDGSFFPVPPFALLGPMVLAQPKKAPFFALVGTVASLFGGALGYALGFYASEWVKATLGIDLDVRITRFGLNVTIAEALSSNVWMLALLASVLPTPFKVVAIGAGLLRVELWAFAVAALFGRSVRMFGFCLTVAYARDFATKRFKLSQPPNTAA